MSPSTSSTSSADEESVSGSKSRAQKAEKGLGDCVLLDKEKIGDFRFKPTVTYNHEEKEPSGSGMGGRRADSARENVFSFKKFLQSDNQANYQATGARPKVYDGRTKPQENNKNNHDSGIYSRNPTELPDFVQDHLVMEQCFLNEGMGPKPDNIEWGHLPDFALNSIEKSQRWNPETTNHIKDEQDCMWRNLSRPIIGTSNPFNSQSPQAGPSSSTLDREYIPRSSGPSNLGADVTQNSSDRTEAPKLLPDFLTNAPLRRESPLTSGQDYLADGSTAYTAMENERLKAELEVLRRQTNKHLARITELEAELLRMEQEAIANREFLDDELHGMKKAHDCDQEVTSLKIMVESLNVECNRLRTENRELKLATSCLNCKDIDPTLDRRMFGLERRVAEDLRIIATTTEVSLRQLLTGVNNMRALAIALDNMERIEDASKAKDFLPESDDDNAAGPAL